MFNELNKNINECKEKIILKETLENKINGLKNILKHKEDELDYLNKILSKELKDLRKIKRISIKSIVATILGNKQDKLYKEEKEYFEAKIKYDECLNVIDGYKRDIYNLYSRISALNGVEAQYKDLINEKYKIIKRHSIIDVELYNLEIKREKLTKEKFEIEEALVEVKNCLNIIEDIRNSLENAKSLGSYDIIAGDFLSSMIKHNKIDDARDNLNKLGYAISKLNKELKDVNMAVDDINLNIGNFTYAFDIFFDNIFSDMSVQNRINDGLNKIKILQMKIFDLSRKLNYKNDNINYELKNIDNDINKIIEKI